MTCSSAPHKTKTDLPSILFDKKNLFCQEILMIYFLEIKEMRIKNRIFAL